MIIQYSSDCIIEIMEVSGFLPSDITQKFGSIGKPQQVVMN